MFNALPDSPLTASRHRLLAPMPDSQLFALREDGLQAYEIDHHIPLSRPLAQRLLAAGKPGDVLHVADADGQPWRLRRCGAAPASSMWRAQSLDHSRCRLIERLRAVLAPKLAAQVLHELRNPMNALSLHADLLARTLPKTDDPQQRARAEASVQVIKSRLIDLNRRQSQMVALWLALSQPGLDAGESSVAAALESSLHLMRGMYALNDVVLRAENLDRVTAGVERPATQHLHLVLIALLAMACESAARPDATTREVCLRVSDRDDGGIGIEIGPTVDGSMMAGSLGATEHAGTLAALSLLLEAEGAALDQPAERGLVRLVLPQSAGRA